MIVRPKQMLLHRVHGVDQTRFVAGEILEKATRMLTDAEKAQMEVEFVGKNGQRRKLEVRRFLTKDTDDRLTFASPPAHHGSSKAEEVFPVRGQMEGYVVTMWQEAFRMLTPFFYFIQAWITGSTRGSHEKT